MHRSTPDFLKPEFVHDFLYLLRAEPLVNVTLRVEKACLPPGTFFWRAQLMFPEEVHLLGRGEQGSFFACTREGTEE